MMEQHQFEERVAQVKQRAHGRWGEIMRALGIDEKILSRRNQPCPICGGEDRFQYTDKYGQGNYHCRGCGPGGGLKLLQAAMGWDFGTVLKRTEEYLGCTTPLQIRTEAPLKQAVSSMKKLAKRIWDEAQPISQGDEVDRYLRERGLQLTEYPHVLRFHPSLGYYEKDAAGKSQQVSTYPAMLACIQGFDGHAVTLHRTYLKDGRKVQRRDAKKVLSAGINGGAVRLYEPVDELAIAEGIETALAVYLSTGKPVWSAINAGNMEKLWLPSSIGRICIYADNDADTNYDGQAYAYALARRLKKEEGKTGPRQVTIFVPRHAGTDWADVWQARSDNTIRAA
jgi:putative DNA primase/helicase